MAVDDPVDPAKRRIVTWHFPESYFRINSDPVRKPFDRLFSRESCFGRLAKMKRNARVEINYDISGLFLTRFGLQRGRMAPLISSWHPEWHDRQVFESFLRNIKMYIPTSSVKGLSWDRMSRLNECRIYMRRSRTSEYHHEDFITGYKGRKNYSTEIITEACC